MAATFGYVLAQLQRWSLPCLEELSDAMLLERFIQRRDESAFAALVTRYGGMVYRSCRRVLGDAHSTRKTPVVPEPITTVEADHHGGGRGRSRRTTWCGRTCPSTGQ